MIESGASNSQVATPFENSTQSKLKLFSFKGTNFVEITIPLVTVSEANGGKKKKLRRAGKTVYRSESWVDAYKRHKKQKGIVHLMLKPLRSALKLPCHITLTRYAPDKLDRFDNLPMAFKWILDACCEIITGDYRPGRADDTDLIDVSYKQELNSEYGIKIHIHDVTPSS